MSPCAHRPLLASGRFASGHAHESSPKALLWFHGNAENIGFGLERNLLIDAGHGGLNRREVELDAGPQHANSMGTVHSGILCDTTDRAMGMAFASILTADESFTTVELKISSFRTGVEGATQERKQRSSTEGKTMGYLEREVTNHQERLVAKAGPSYLVLRGEKGTGR